MALNTVFAGLLALAYFCEPVASLVYIRQSKCAAACGDKSTISDDDVVCPDSSFNSTAEGLTIRDCLLCQSTGTTYVTDERSDTYNFLSNQKFTLQTCLFQRSGETSISSCEDSCHPLRSILTSQWYRTNSTLPIYDYCSSTFGQYAGDCVSCLQGKKGSVILGNFKSLRLRLYRAMSLY
ncbi:hypothetical protein BDV25DRAFT_153771 [Aspergillus avenaceus]|uniref:Cyanovirin-N domain-containing protein n=1 Tax=Aspergillus avenaceus TaxID=36643 RepID=A0A5N6TWX8_ASPAV|nr:hypothetical protein BDV25DRAFT_153771 [Aspergillus avenaceus]